MIPGIAPTITPNGYVLVDEWNTVANMPTGRSGHAAAPLKDGRVLICGGSDSGGDRLRTWIYDPSTNSWSTAANMPATRHDHAAAPLGDGRVLVCGGSDSGGDRLTTWIYDPSTNSWSTVANMPATRREHAAAPLGDGRVLVCGGNSSTNTAWIYDPSTNSWSTAADLPDTRLIHAAAPLGDGRVLVCGGRAGWFVPSPTNTALIYDPSTNSWSSVANMPAARRQLAAAPLKDGRVLVCGGVESNSGTKSSNTAWIYDPTADSWSTVANMPAPRYIHAAAPLKDGRVLVCGGYNLINTTWIYG